MNLQILTKKQQVAAYLTKDDIRIMQERLQKLILLTRQKQQNILNKLAAKEITKTLAANANRECRLTLKACELVYYTVAKTSTHNGKRPNFRKTLST